MREIEFTKDFANKNKGEKMKCDGQLASQLVRVDKVAKFTDARKTTNKVTKEDKVKK